MTSTSEMRRSGISVVGDRPWGTHFCNFYESGKDLFHMLLSYFKAGLEDNEFCVWVVSEPLSERDAWDGLREAVPDFDQYLSERSIEVNPRTAPKSWTEKTYSKLIHYNRLPKGGHFAAWEQPQLFSEELRASFRSLR